MIRKILFIAMLLFIAAPVQAVIINDTAQHKMEVNSDGSINVVATASITIATGTVDVASGTLFSIITDILTGTYATVGANGLEVTDTTATTTVKVIDDGTIFSVTDAAATSTVVRADNGDRWPIIDADATTTVRIADDGFIMPVTDAAATSTVVRADNGDVWPISAASLPLPPDAATESTLNDVFNEIQDMKDTDGIKKITDELPAGTQTIGKIKITDGTDDLDILIENAAIGAVKKSILSGTRADDATFRAHRSAMPNADGEPANAFVQVVGGYVYGFNGTTWDRLRSVGTGQLVITIKNSSGLEPTISTLSGNNTLAVNVIHEHDDNIHLDAENISADTGFMLIDLSNTSGNWPHSSTNEIHVTEINVDINPSTTFEGDIEIGFLTSVDVDNGDFNIIYTWHLDRKGINFVDRISAKSVVLKMITDHWFGPITANDTTFQTDVNLQGPDGAVAYPSGDGDLVMKINVTAGAGDVGIMVQYHTE